MAIAAMASGIASAAPAGTPPIRIMPLGDSITAGYHVGNGGYRKPLQDMLESAGVHIDFVGRSTDQSGDMQDPEHEGYSGFTIDQVAAKAREALAAESPDIILLFAGSNDIRVNGNNGDPASPLYWKTAPDRLDALITDLSRLASNAVIIVGGLMPFAGTWAEREPAAQEFNARLITIVARHQKAGRAVCRVDFRKTVKAADLADGLHPNAVGYKKMAKTWFQEIMKQRLTLHAKPLPASAH